MRPDEVCPHVVQVLRPPRGAVGTGVLEDHSDPLLTRPFGLVVFREYLCLRFISKSCHGALESIEPQPSDYEWLMLVLHLFLMCHHHTRKPDFSVRLLFLVTTFSDVPFYLILDLA